MFKHTLSTLALAALVAPAVSADENWMTDLPSALKKAGDEGKLVLVDFNGSDWCGPCIALKSRVFDTPAFLEYAKDKFILVDIDVPRNKTLEPAQMMTNQALVKEFEVSGFPTILVLSPEGYALGGFVGGRSSVKDVTPVLDAAIANKAKYAAAAGLEGSAKAQALFDAHKAIAPTSNPRLMKDAVACDTDDVLGLRAEMASKSKVEDREAEVRGKLAAAGRNLEALAKVYEEELATDTLSNELRRELLSRKASMMMHQAQNMEELMAAKAVFLEAGALSGEEMGFVENQVSRIFADPEAMLERNRARRPENH